MSVDTMIFAVAQFIETKFGVTCTWTIGTNLFAGALPEKRPDGTDMPIRCAVILEHDPGALVPDLPDWAEAPFQIWNRGEDYEEAHQDAWCLFNSIHGTAGWTLPVIAGWAGSHTYDAMVINAMGKPAPIESPDERGRFIFSTNYLWSIANAP